MSKKNQSVIQDYLKTIYKIHVESNVPVSTSQVARKLNVTVAAVTLMIKKLANQGYVNHKPYHGFTLSDKGQRIAIMTLRRHRIIEQYLVEKLNLGWDEVDQEAETLEHSVSDKVIEQMWLKLGKPKTDPHGSPIPDSEGAILEDCAAKPLGDWPVRKKLQVVRIKNKSPKELRYLKSIGLIIGSECCILDKTPFNRSIVVETSVKFFALDESFSQSIYGIEINP